VSLPIRPLFPEAARALRAEGAATADLARRLDNAAAGRVLWDDWTVKDVLAHLAASHEGFVLALRGAVTPTPGLTLAEINESRVRERRDWTLAQVCASLDARRAELASALDGLADADWEQTIRTASGRSWRAGEIAWTGSRHERGHREEIARALGDPVTPARVDWLNASGGGVPKWPIQSARLGRLGLEGDAHRSPRHGGENAALCLFATEVIERIRAEGHPIFPGAIGENVTVAGLDWARIGPGDRLRIGEAVVEITRYTVPCANIAGAFLGGDVRRVLADEHPGESRAYARVVEVGVVAVGDPVERLPAG
jgi:MOSC domain-containing protein YiiM